MRSFSNYRINSKNLKYNISMFRRLLKDGVKLCAVVKANAYSLGVEEIIKLIDKEVDYYAVSNVIEAKQIRDLGYNTKILVLGAVPLTAIEYCAINNIDIAIFSIDYLRAVICNVPQGYQLHIHLKVNTGLNRYGFKDTKVFDKALKLAQNSDNIILDGVFTHFATKDNDIDYINIQKDIFDRYCQMCPKDIIRHCANSFATTLSSIYQMDMVRIGVNMYGDIREERLLLKDVVSIDSVIVNINDVKATQTVGYDRTYKSTRNSKVAVVPLGYADGISRRASNKMRVLINGQFAKIVGNVCMDCFMVDVTDIPNVYVGTKVTIVGKAGDERGTFGDWGRCAGTSAYDIMVGFRHDRYNYLIE